jgi:hypothetical protein
MWLKSRKVKERPLRYGVTTRRQQQKILKCKNEATKLLKIKDRTWVRPSKRKPSKAIFSVKEPRI